MPSFIYAVFLILSFNVLSGYFMFRKKLTTDPPVVLHPRQNGGVNLEKVYFNKFRDKQKHEATPINKPIN